MLYVYRPKQYNVLAGVVPNATPHYININDQHVAQLSNGGYFACFVTPGTNTIGSGMKYAYSWADALGNRRPELLRTNFDAGETYYLRFSMGAWGPKLRPVDARTGEKEIQSVPVRQGRLKMDASGRHGKLSHRSLLSTRFRFLR